MIDFIRASGDCVCRVCNKTYRNHPYDEKILSGIADWDGKFRPFLRIICDGTRVKL